MEDGESWEGIVIMPAALYSRLRGPANPPRTVAHLRATIAAVKSIWQFQSAAKLSTPWGNQRTLRRSWPFA